jgi:hypothetical protein
MKVELRKQHGQDKREREKLSKYKSAEKELW